MPAEKKVIAVVGATGAQGSGLVRAIAHEGDRSEFTVRAIVRNANSPRAQWLAKLGVEMAEADINDERGLTEAIRGCYGMFCVSFFWEHNSAEEELQQAKNMANAAKNVGLKHVVWSTFEDSRKTPSLKKDELPTLQGSYKVPHCDAKAEGDRFFEESGVPTTYLLTDFYWDNFIIWGMGPKKSPDGRVLLTLPMADKHIPGIAAEDIGKCAYGIFKRPGQYTNKRIGIMGEALTVARIARKMTKAFGINVEYEPMDLATYRKSGVPGADELANMFKFFQDCEQDLMLSRSVEESRMLNPDLMTFEEWLMRFKDQFPISDWK